MKLNKKNLNKLLKLFFQKKKIWEKETGSKEILLHIVSKKFS